MLHINHKQRIESELEEIEIKTFVESLWITYIWSSYNTSFWNKENHLRKWRKQFFNSHIQRFSQTDSVIFMSWHHLDDRIETSQLNIERWAGSRWKSNMSLSKKVYLKGFKGGVLQYVYLRPLIETTKKEIYEIAQNQRIIRFEDKTNTDVGVSKRNQVRVGNNNKNKQQKEDYYIYWKKFYLENTHNPTDIEIITLRIFCDFIQDYYKIEKISTIEQIQTILDFLWIYQWVSHNFLLEMVDFVKIKSWYKYFKGRYFFRSHWFLYLVKSKRRFREEKFVLPLEWKNEKSIIRSNKEWDIFRWKRFRKFLINQKIPFFLRGFIPVETMDWRVINTLFHKDLKIMKII